MASTLPRASSTSPWGSSGSRSIHWPAGAGAFRMGTTSAWNGREGNEFMANGDRSVDPGALGHLQRPGLDARQRRLDQAQLGSGGLAGGGRLRLLRGERQQSQQRKSRSPLLMEGIIAVVAAIVGILVLAGIVIWSLVEKTGKGAKAEQKLDDIAGISKRES